MMDISEVCGGPMRAEVGDRLVVESPSADTHRRTGVVTEVRGAEGTPPYRVQWLGIEQGRDALVYPGPDAHIEHPPEPGADGEGTDAMQTMKRWNVDLVVAEESDGDAARTWAEVGMIADDGTALRGHGMARKHPSDLDAGDRRGARRLPGTVRPLTAAAPGGRGGHQRQHRNTMAPNLMKRAGRIT